ncbi:hypothetical protein [Salinicola peritrichatus]|uniref:hypothetical protein n=1 Tax=Salinicola peritrichatus TaxID=1267424 RepID=UPI0013A66C29|nr:hypothetical protein [Salinicola peritrichatus]
MKLSDNTSGFLRGKCFSNDLVATFDLEPADHEYRSRFDVLTERVADKQVIHVGCVDHGSAGIRKKMQRGRWLHQALDQAATRCFGVDIDAEGIHYMRETLGYSDVAAANILAFGGSSFGPVCRSCR